MPVLSRPPDAPSASPPEPGPAPVAPPATPLSYTPPERTVSRRAFRLLWAMTLLNTVLIVLNIGSGNGWQFVQRQWSSWKQARAEAAALRQNLALQQQALTFRAPADRVVYTEDPVEAANLISTDPLYKALGGGSGTPPIGWQPPAAANDPDAAEFLRRVGYGGPFPAGGRVTVSWGNNDRNGNALLFLHERTTPGGQKRLVAVRVTARHMFHTYSRNTRQASLRVWERTVERLLSGDAWEVSADGLRPDRTANAERSMLLPDSRRREIGVLPLSLSDGAAESAKLEKGNVVRFLAGQPDPVDASRFTIPYTIDGRPGVIDGHVSDAGLLLRPREAKAVGVGRGAGWDLSPVPTTSESVTPPGPKP